LLAQPIARLRPSSASRHGMEAHGALISGPLLKRGASLRPCVT
jgi:hypothetical protein